MKYKVGDKVRIKSLDWYNENKDETDDIECTNNIWFYREMSKFCGKVMTIFFVGVDYYTMAEDLVVYWTDEMIEGLVEETKPEFKIGDKITNGKTQLTILKITSDKYIVEDNFGECGTLYFNTKGDWTLVEEETSKFKIDDIVFVKNIGWVRITNSYWDSLANEYIYEAIGFNGEGEYDSINQSNIECQMLPESENPPTCGNKITLDEYKNNDKEWLFNKLAMLDNITALESIQDIFNHLQQSKYPKTYEECCKIMGINHTNDLDICEHCDYKTEITYYEDSLLEKIEALYRLRICRDAYWKIAGEEMGLGKPWKPNWDKCNGMKYCIYPILNCIRHDAQANEEYENRILAFPTEEMRDAFYENFKEEIEICKDLL